MKNKEVTLPKKKYEYGYELAYQLASEQLAGIADIEQQCLNSGAQYIDSRKIGIKYLNRSYLINIPDAEVLPETGEETVPIRDQILILHYFTQAKGTPLSHKLVTYRRRLPLRPRFLPAGDKTHRRAFWQRATPATGYRGSFRRRES